MCSSGDPPVKVKKIQRGRPDFAATQPDEILRLLREAGPRGVSKAYLIFEKRFTQCGARVFELQQMGYAIRSEQRDGERFVTYILEGEPLQLKPLPPGADWYTRQTGKPRPTEPAPGPLFSQTEADRQ